MATSRKWIRAIFGLNKFRSSEKDESNKFKSSEKNDWSKFRSSEKDKYSKFKSSEKDEQHQQDLASKEPSNEMKSYMHENQLDSPVVPEIDSSKDSYFPSMKDSVEIEYESIDKMWQQKEHGNETETDEIENQLDTDVSYIDSAKDANFQSVKDFGEIEYELYPNGISEFEGINNASFLSSRHSVDISGDTPENVLNEHSQGIEFQSISDLASRLSTSLVVTKTESAKDASFESVLDPPCLSSALIQVQNAPPIQQSMSEECASIHIQEAYRRFMARRALRSFRGIIRLHGLTRGPAVRKQVSLALHSMQDLVRVQARSRARQSHVALENQIARQNVQQHVEHENRDRERKARWCDSVGSVEEVRAKTLKKKEATSRREKAMAYALARQWQAGSRQRVKPVAIGSGQDKVYWSWKWSESWLATSQWESQSSSTDVEDGVKTCVNEPAGAQHKVVTQNVGKRKLVRSSSNRSDVSSERTSSHNCSLPLPPRPHRSPGTIAKDSVEESTSRLSLGPRSRSTPRERSSLGDIKGKKQLPLPDSGPHNGVQPAKQPNRPAIKRSNTAPKPQMPKTKNGSNW